MSFSNIYVNNFYSCICLYWLQISINCTAQKMNFSIKDLFSKCDQIGKLHFLCSVGYLTPSRHLHKMKSFALQETDYWRTTYRLIDKPNWLLPFKKHDLHYSKFNEFLKNVVYFKEIWRFRNFRKILKMKY